jgi:chromosome segregation ATPase
MVIRANSNPPAPIPLAPAKNDHPTAFNIERSEGTSALAPEPVEAAPLEGTIEPEKLVLIEPTKRLEVFTLPGGLDSIIEVITTVARKLKPDVTTDKGRKAIASNAYKVAQCKSLLDAAGKEETAKAKEIPNKIDAARRDMRTRLEALQDEVRKPLTDWEAEQARIEAERVAAEAAAALAREIEADHEIALTLNWAFDQRKKQEAEELERMVAERDAEIAREAAETAKQDAAAALAKAEQDKADAIQREKDAEARAEQARKDAEAAAEKAKKDAAELAERNRLAAIKAQQEADARAEAAAKLAREQEQQRQEAARKAEVAAQAARDNDKAHKQAFNLEALADLQGLGLSEQDAKQVINAVYLKKVRHLSINY